MGLIAIAFLEAWLLSLLNTYPCHCTLLDLAIWCSSVFMCNMCIGLFILSVDEYTMDCSHLLVLLLNIQPNFLRVAYLTVSELHNSCRKNLLSLEEFFSIYSFSTCYGLISPNCCFTNHNSHILHLHCHTGTFHVSGKQCKASYSLPWEMIIYVVTGTVEQERGEDGCGARGWSFRHIRSAVRSSAGDRCQPAVHATGGWPEHYVAI